MLPIMKNQIVLLKSTTVLIVENIIFQREKNIFEERTSEK